MGKEPALWEEGWGWEERELHLYCVPQLPLAILCTHPTGSREDSAMHHTNLDSAST